MLPYVFAPVFELLESRVLPLNGVIVEDEAPPLQLRTDEVKRHNRTNLRPATNPAQCKLSDFSAAKKFNDLS